jgi:Zn-dependent protease with chaperone function
MIPSSPARTGAFLTDSLAAFFAPDLLAPAAWQHDNRYLVFCAGYQAILVLLGFILGPAICRALVVRPADAGPTKLAVVAAQASTAAALPAQPRLTLFQHPLPFVLTVGLRPDRCETFLSTGLAGRLSVNGLRFLLARAAVHATWPHRLADILPVVALTVLVPDTPSDAATWWGIGVGLVFWLGLHWAFELHADKRAGALLSDAAASALLECTRAQGTRMSLSPPRSWRLRAVVTG